MARYLAIPKRDVSVSVLSRATVRFDKQARTSQIDDGVELTNITMIPKGIGRLSDFVSAIEFVASDPEISILNMSAGIPGYHDGMRVAVEAIVQTGVLPVIAVGNEGRNTSRSPGNYREVLSALIIERHPTITGADLQAELLGAVRKLPGVPAARQGEGLAQLPGALRRP